MSRNPVNVKYQIPDIFVLSRLHRVFFFGITWTPSFLVFYWGGADAASRQSRPGKRGEDLRRSAVAGEICNGFGAKFGLQPAQDGFLRATQRLAVGRQVIHVPVDE
jgi:hypothetical protein